ncbi:MAG: sensor histidine kinase [Candidatus Eisenbacteria bacterium]
MARRLSSRLLALQFAIVACALLAVSSTTVWLTERVLIEQDRHALVDVAEGAAVSIAREWTEEGDLATAARATLEEDPLLGYRLDVLDDHHRVVASSPGPRSPATDREIMSHEVRLPHGAWVIVSVSTVPRRRAMTTLIGVSGLMVAAVFLLTFLVGRVLVRRQLAPLARVAAQADRLAADMRIRPLHDAKDPVEIASVTMAFDHLLARLDVLLESERDFTRDAAHELRTPLTVVSGELEYALADDALPAPHRRHLESALVEVRTLGELVDALLLLRESDVRRADRTGAEDPVNLADVVREIVAMLLAERPTRAADLAVHVPDEALVAGSVDLLAAAVRNLVDNALKFTNTGTPLRVTITEDGEGILLAVEDGGVGIASDEIERVFDPFYRSAGVRAKMPGFGLGLPLARRIIRADGGELRLDRSDLGGARFEIHLPPFTAARSGAGPAANPR